jgi:catecholate siderophore receptor
VYDLPRHWEARFFGLLLATMSHKGKIMVRRIKIRKKSSKPGQRGPKYWMAVGTLAAYTTFGSNGITQVYAQQDRNAPASDGSPAQTQGLPVRRFDIPPGPLDSVLTSFQNAAGINVIVPRQQIRSIWSPGVAGLYTVERALQKLLTGTGVAYRFTDPGSATLDIQGPATAVEVTATALPDVLPKFTEPLVDTPQSITVIPQNVMQSQGASTLRDVLRNVAGISLAAGEGGAQGDNLTIRGFTARNDLFIDGMRDFGSYYRDPFNYQEVEVLKGPSSVTFGRGSTGGVVNQATKSPLLDRQLGGSLDFGSDLTRRVTAGFNQPLPSLGDGAAFRLNLMGHDSQVAGRDVAEARRFGIAPSLAFGLGTPTRLTFSYLHEQADDTPDYGIPWFFDRPADVPRENYYGFKHGSYLKTDVDMGTARFEHDFSSSVRLRSQFRYANYGRNARITEARIPVPPLVNPDTPADEIDVTRNQIAVDSAETFLQSQTDVIFTFRTGFARHTLVTGLEAGRETSDPIRFNYANVPGTSLLNPNPDEPFAGEQSVRTRVNASAESVGGYALDTVRLGSRWELTGGVRVDRFDTRYEQRFPAAQPLARPDVMTSFRGAVVYKPTAAGSIYFGYGNSFNPSAESLSLAANTADIAPEENKTYEVGTKWDLYSRNLSVRASVFRTDKTNAREPSLADPSQNELVGRQHANGFEVEANGRITSRWHIFAGYAYVDATVVKSISRPETIGARLANVPKNTFNFWSIYQTPWKLELGGGGLFVDSRTASSTAPLDPFTLRLKEAPGYWVFNAMAKYPLGEHLDLQVNLYNLTDKYYYDLLHPGHIVPGPARSALVGMNFHF